MSNESQDENANLNLTRHEQFGRELLLSLLNNKKPHPDLVTWAEQDIKRLTDNQQFMYEVGRAALGISPWPSEQRLTNFYGREWGSGYRHLYRLALAVIDKLHPTYRPLILQLLREETWFLALWGAPAGTLWPGVVPACRSTWTGTSDIHRGMLAAAALTAQPLNYTATNAQQAGNVWFHGTITSLKLSTPHLIRPDTQVVLINFENGGRLAALNGGCYDGLLCGVATGCTFKGVRPSDYISRETVLLKYPSLRGKSETKAQRRSRSALSGSASVQATLEQRGVFVNQNANYVRGSDNGPANAEWELLETPVRIQVWDKDGLRDVHSVGSQDVVGGNPTSPSVPRPPVSPSTPNLPNDPTIEPHPQTLTLQFWGRNGEPAQLMSAIDEFRKNGTPVPAHLTTLLYQYSVMNIRDAG